MWQRSSRAPYVEILLFTLSSLLLFLTGIGLLFFMVPLQVLAIRRGFRGLALAAALFLVVLAAVQFWPTVTSAAHPLPDIQGAIEMALGAVCMAGMLVVNLPLARRPRTLVMLMAAAGAAGAVLVPLGLAVSPMPGFQQALDQLFAEASRALSAVFAPPADSGAASFFSQMVRPDRLRAMTEATLLRSFLADFLALFTFSWWAGQAAARRALVFLGIEGGFRLSRFRLESRWLWPLILSGTAVLADLFLGISARGFAVLAYAAWNLGLSLLFLYGLQGMAIVMYLFEKYRLPRFLWLLLVAGIVVLAVRPGAGMIVLLVIPVLGIAENWVRLRVPRKAEPNE